jgi:hypothetical protein
MVAEDPRSLFYHDLDSSDGDYWISKLRPQSIASFRAKTKSAAWRKITSSYLICEDGTQQFFSAPEDFSPMSLLVIEIPY